MCLCFWGFTNKIIPILFYLQEIILIVVFVVEYCVRFWAAGCRSAYVGIKGRLRFAVQIYSLIGMILIKYLILFFFLWYCVSMWLR